MHKLKIYEKVFLLIIICKVNILLVYKNIIEKLMILNIGGKLLYV